MPAQVLLISVCSLAIESGDFIEAYVHFPPASSVADRQDREQVRLKLAFK